jgi:hypothetical protein
VTWPFFAVTFVLLLPVVVWRIRRAARVLDDLLNETPAADGPDLDAGADRLRAAIDEQQKGEQA